MLSPRGLPRLPVTRQKAQVRTRRANRIAAEREAARRGYRASDRAITAFDVLTQEAINLKR